MKKIIISTIALIIVAGSTLSAFPETTYAILECKTPRDNRGLSSDGKQVCVCPDPTAGDICHFVPRNESAQRLTQQDSGLGLVAGWIRDGLFAIGVFSLEVAGSILYYAGLLLNYSIEYTVTNMTAFVNGIEGINIAWRAIRDLANIIFIFLLVFIAVKTILGLSGRELIPKIIVVALLINFSLFFTKTLIDASNIVALQFYRSIATDIDDKNSGFSFSIMKPLRLTTIYATGNEENLGNLTETSGTQSLFQDTVLSKSGYGIIATFLGTAVVLVAAAVFFYAAFLFVARFAILVYLMATSPLAFVGIILPQANAGWWRETLVQQLIFAPSFLILMWIALTIINDDGFIKLTAGTNTGAATWQGLFTKGGFAGSVAIVLNYALVLTFMMFALSISKKFGGQAASYAQKGLGKVLGLGVGGGVGGLLRQTVGRGASALAKSEGMKDFAARSIIGRGIMKGTRGLATSRFDVRAGAVGAGVEKLGIGLGTPTTEGGYEAKLEKQVKTREAFGESLGYNKEKAYEQERVIGDLQQKKGLWVAGMKATKPGITDAEIERDPVAKDFSNKIRDAKEELLVIKGARRQAYIGALRRPSIDTIWTKIARKDKVAAAKFAIKNLKEKLEKKEKKLNEVKSDIKTLQKKDRDTRTPLSDAEKEEMKRLLEEQYEIEKEVREKKLRISENEAIE